MARKLFLSILGTGRYMPCSYSKDGMVLDETKFIQQALIEYLQKSNIWTHNDKVIIFLTEKARKTHWIPTSSDEEGLESLIKNKEVSYEGVAISDGNSDEQMWSIFETIYSQFEEGDELYIDITHSFRYLPMLLIVLVNYAKLLKNVTVKGIYYGNWEAKNEEGIAPIMDLLPLSLLQDWTIAASDFLQYGQIKKLFAISNEPLKGILKNQEGRTNDNLELSSFLKALQDTVNDRLTCRGKNIIDSPNLTKLKKSADKIENVTITQLKPIFEKIKRSLSDYGTGKDVKNCIKAASWCFENNLHQQCITLLEEGIITLFADAIGKNYRFKSDRNLIDKCIYILSHPELPEDQWNVTDDNQKEEIKQILNSDLGHWSGHEFLNLIGKIKDLRNDYNHAGFKETSRKADTIIKQINDYLIETELFLGIGRE